MLADTRVSGCGGGAPSEGITLAGKREKGEVKARFGKQRRRAVTSKRTRLQVARR